MLLHLIGTTLPILTIPRILRVVAECWVKDRTNRRSHELDLEKVKLTRHMYDKAGSTSELHPYIALVRAEPRVIDPRGPGHP